MKGPDGHYLNAVVTLTVTQSDTVSLDVLK